MGGDWWKEQVGPLPLGVWLLAIAGGVGVAFYARHAAPDTPADVIDDPLAVAPLPATQGALVGVNNSSSTGASSSPTTNEEWVTAASRQLIAAGFSPTLVTAALVRYLRGDTLTAVEQQAVDAALRTLGPPPVPAEPPASSSTSTTVAAPSPLPPTPVLPTYSQPATTPPPPAPVLASDWERAWTAPAGLGQVSVTDPTIPQWYKDGFPNYEAWAAAKQAAAAPTTSFTRTVATYTGGSGWLGGLVGR